MTKQFLAHAIYYSNVLEGDQLKKYYVITMGIFDLKHYSFCSPLLSSSIFYDLAIFKPLSICPTQDPALGHRMESCFIR